MISEVETEDEDEEGLDHTKGVVCSLAVGDRTSGVRGCKTVGSRTALATKLSDFVLNRLCSKRMSKSRS